MAIIHEYLQVFFAFIFTYKKSNYIVIISVKKSLEYLANTQPRESVDISSKNDREWSGFSIYLALPLEHCLSSIAASLREAAKISVCRKTVGTNVFFEEISTDSLSVSSHSTKTTQLTKILCYDCLILNRNLPHSMI